MDAFYASVEQRDAPELRGQPVVVAWRGGRSVVCAASYEARRYGVRSAMPAVRAARLCPDAVFVPPDFTRYRTVSRQVREILLQHTDLVEPLSLDEAYLDVTENKTGLPTATRVAKAIRDQIREQLHLTASAGVAPNKFLAKIASDWRKPDGQFVIQPQEVDAFLLPLPVGRLPGVGKVMGEKLEGMGVATVSHLREIDQATLERRFGRFPPRTPLPRMCCSASWSRPSAAWRRKPGPPRTSRRASAAPWCSSLRPPISITSRAAIRRRCRRLPARN